MCASKVDIQLEDNNDKLFKTSYEILISAVTNSLHSIYFCHYTTLFPEHVQHDQLWLVKYS